MAFLFRPPARTTNPTAPTSTGIYGHLGAWCRGRSALLRSLLWLYLAYVGYRQYETPVEFNSIFAGINLGIHEGGHLLFRPFGNDLLHIAGGTLAQVAAPIIVMVILWGQRDYFGIPFGLGWLSTNFIAIGVYMSDARAEELPLVTAEGGDGAPIHDWNYLFSHFGLLNDDIAIGQATRALGTATMVLALILGACIIAEIIRQNRKGAHYFG